jgi:hypothetical protein
MKKWPKFARFQKKKIQNCQVFMISFMIKYKGIYFILLSYWLCNQIWIKYFLNDCYFDYITKRGFMSNLFKI